jgi:hypothetical protein
MREYFARILNVVLNRPKENHMFDVLKSDCATVLQTLKTDARSVEERIEAAFEEGALAHALKMLENAPNTIAEKLRNAFEMGKSAQ